MKATREIYYRDRSSNQLITEIIDNEAFLRWFYENSLGFQVLNIAFNCKAPQQLYATLKRSSKSRANIAAFVEKHSINVEEIELPLSRYRSFNEFFTRKLKPGKRIFDRNPSIFCSPADGKVLVYPQLEAEQKIPIKGTSITISDLLDSNIAANPYRNGSALIVRLAPYDYHRFHFPVSGIAQGTVDIQGQYHSVNPIALAKVPDVFCRNRRAVTTFWSDQFGQIACIEVGALTVGSIVQTYQSGRVEKGQEKGYFQYGGSTIVLLFEPNRIQFDDDLIRDSMNQLEVHVSAGNKIGHQAASDC